MTNETGTEPPADLGNDAISQAMRPWTPEQPSQAVRELPRAKATGYCDKFGKQIRDGDIVSGWFSAPWDEQVPIQRHFRVTKWGKRWFCEGVEGNDEDDFLCEFKGLEVVKL